MTPVAATAANRGFQRKAPRRIRNSPTNPLRPGKPIDDKVTIRKTATSRGGFALADDAGLLVVALAAQVLQYAGFLDFALELLERPVETIGFIQLDFNHRFSSRGNVECRLSARGKRESRTDAIGPALDVQAKPITKSERYRPSFVTFSAAGPLAPWTMSNSTRSPSASVLKPLPWMAEWWTKQSF